MGFTLRELLDLDYGEVSDVLIEGANDHAKYNYIATQDDIDNMFG